MNEHSIYYNNCPACGSTAIQNQIKAIDYTVSTESFDIWHCNNCNLRFTQSIPTAANIGPYYQSTNYVSHSDTQKGLIHRCYHLVRSHTLNTKRKLVQKLTGLNTGALLDVGAGTGAFSKTMENAGWLVTGLEPDDTARKNAIQINNIDLKSPETMYDIQGESFDAISLWHVLEHVHNLHGYLDQFHHILKPTGKLIIAVPNYTSYDASYYGAYWAAYDVPRHLYHFSPASIEQLANQKGFTLNCMQPMWFDSFYVAMLSEQYKNGKNNLLAAVWVGLVSNLKALFNNKKASSVIYILSKKLG